MNVLQLVQEGDLDRALAAAQQNVRADAANADFRVALFQLFCIAGEWDRAVTQLEVLSELGAAPLLSVAYRQAIRCENLRTEVFRGDFTPVVMGQPQEWVGSMISALDRDARNQPEEAARLREHALSTATVSAGSVRYVGDDTDLGAGKESDVSIQWIADADSRLGPILEAIVEGKYLWVPFQHIRQIKIHPPDNLCDIVWVRAEFTWQNGGKAPGLIPTRYVESHHSPDPQIRLARKTEWSQAGPNVYFGLGQRLFATDTGDYALMDLRQIDLINASEDPK